MSEQIVWVMPDWMEPYRDYIANTGGNSVEALMHTYYNEPRILITNLPRGVLAISCSSQVALLTALHQSEGIR